MDQARAERRVGECSELAGGGGGRGGGGLVVTSWSEVEFVGNGKKKKDTMKSGERLKE